ncbi:MAG: alpha-L-fucosidase [Ruthenibacterium sp.]
MKQGNQRLSAEKLQAWREHKFGLIIHFGTSTYDGAEMSSGTLPLEQFNPEKLDVRQWVQAGKTAGARYMILTAKHVGGLCLWPTAYTEYNCMNTPIKRDIVGEFCAQCRKENIAPCLYYCSWDNHHLFGSQTPSMTNWDDAFVTQEYLAFHKNQIMELLDRYAPIAELWIDIPHVLGRSYRTALYEAIAKKSPDTVIVYNHGLSMRDGSVFHVAKAWPTDIITIEKNLPNSTYGYDELREIEGEIYQMPGEVMETLTGDWFYQPDEKVRPLAELLGMALVADARGCNFVLNVAPNRDGLIAENQLAMLARLRAEIARFA